MISSFQQGLMLFPYRVLQWSTFIDRTFCTETEDERRSWIDSINKVSKDLIKKQNEEAPSSTATGGLKTPEGAAASKQGLKVRGHCGCGIALNIVIDPISMCGCAYFHIWVMS